MMKPQPTWSRRQFLAAAAGTGAAMMLNPLAIWAIDDIDPTVYSLIPGISGPRD